MENAPIPESFPSRRPLTHQEADEAKDILKLSIENNPKYSDFKSQSIVGTLLTEAGFIVTIGVYDKDLVGTAELLAETYISGIPFEVRIIGPIQAG